MANIQHKALLLFFAAFFLPVSHAFAAFPSFEASYRVTSNQYSLAPSATVHHQLDYQEGQLTSHMNASVRLARWEETAHFSHQDDQLLADRFAMYTRVFLSRSNYELEETDFEQELAAYDRQSAIFYMAATAKDQGTDLPRSILLVDERGRAEELVIDVANFTELQGLAVAEIYFWKAKKPKEYTRAFLSTDYPGLLVFAEVNGSKGEKLLTFRLLDWELTD